MFLSFTNKSCERFSALYKSSVVSAYAFLEKVKTYDEVLNCYRITGNENIVMEVVLKNQKHLESFIDQLIIYGETKTQIVLSHVIKYNEVKPVK